MIRLRERLRPGAGTVSRVFGVLLTLLVAVPTKLAADEYPSQVVKMIVPFAPGSSADGLARLVANELQQTLGGAFIIENKPGANGLIAAAEVARSEPNGYTLFFTTNTTQSVNPGFFKTLGYEPIKDFSAIAPLISGQFILVVNTSLPVKSVGELVALARAEPTRLSYGTTNGTSLVAAELLKARAGIEILQIPYKSSPGAFVDLMGGEISMMFGDALNATPLIHDGKLRALAVSGGKRAALLPDIPTMEEAGFPSFVLNSWAGLLGPANMKRELVDRLNGIITKAVEQKPEFANRIRALGYVPVSSTADEFSEFIKAELTRWATAMAAAKIEPK